MVSMTIVLDTSVIVEQLRTLSGVFSDIVREGKQNTSEKFTIIVPTVVIYELWSGLSSTRKDQQEKIEFILNISKIVDLTQPVAKVAGSLRRKKYCDGIDAIVAATTLEHNAYLATLNTKHFKDVPGLKLWK